MGRELPSYLKEPASAWHASFETCPVLRCSSQLPTDCYPATSVPMRCRELSG